MYPMPMGEIFVKILNIECIFVNCGGWLLLLLDRAVRQGSRLSVFGSRRAQSTGIKKTGVAK